MRKVFLNANRRRGKYGERINISKQKMKEIMHKLEDEEEKSDVDEEEANAKA